MAHQFRIPRRVEHTLNSTAENYQMALTAKLAQCYLSNLAALTDVRDKDEVSVQMYRSNLHEIKMLLVGLKSTGSYDEKNYSRLHFKENL